MKRYKKKKTDFIRLEFLNRTAPKAIQLQQPGQMYKKKRYESLAALSFNV